MPDNDFLLPFIVPALYFFVWMPSIAKTQYVTVSPPVFSGQT
jgi:hypothetical protein